MIILFFFSSRRRHTRCGRDWSSDVCSSDLVACNQVLYHLRERAIEHEVIPFCARHGIAVVAYSPFGSGRFPTRDRTLRAIAEAHGVTPYQVALSFLVRDPNVFAIPKAARAEHALDNARAAELALRDEEIRR